MLRRARKAQFPQSQEKSLDPKPAPRSLPNNNCKRLRAPPRQPGRPQDRKGGKRVRGGRAAGLKGGVGGGWTWFSRGLLYTVNLAGLFRTP